MGKTYNKIEHKLKKEEREWELEERKWIVVLEEKSEDGGFSTKATYG